MPSRFLTNAEKEKLENFPAEINEIDKTAFFTLTESDLTLINRRTDRQNRMGFAILLCCLKFFGFIPESFSRMPSEIIKYLADQLKIDEEILPTYQRIRTKQTQIQEIFIYTGFRRTKKSDLEELEKWLVQRALEHDKPSFLLSLVIEKLYLDKILRPGLSVLERLVLKAREEAVEETYRLLLPILNDETRSKLDKLGEIEKGKKQSTLVWLRQPAVSFSADAILQNIRKIKFLREMKVETWDLSLIIPNRQKCLSQVARKSRIQSLGELSEKKRYPILAAFAKQALIDIIDETIELFDRCLMQSYSKAGQELDELRQKNSRSTNEKIHLFYEIGSLILDPEIADAQLREKIFESVNPENLSEAVAECPRIMRPMDDNYFDLWAERYSYFRRFVPHFLSILEFASDRHHENLLQAIEVLKRINEEGRRKLPTDAPTSFISAKWKPYIKDKTGKLSLRFYELCVLWELRAALRGGHLWVSGSYRYANPETYLIPKERWQHSKQDFVDLLRISPNGKEVLQNCQTELENLLQTADNSFNQKDYLRFEGEQLIVSRLKAVEPDDRLSDLEEMLAERLPKIELPDLLIEVDGWTRFSKELVHVSGSEKCPPELAANLYALLVSQACNLGVVRMSEISNLSLNKMLWTHTWHFREETLKKATDCLVNYQYQQSLAKIWGGGTLSSSDGQRFPVSVKSVTATALPKYFGYGRGITFYTWTSDQHSQYGTKVIPSTIRDARYVLDEILNNETELDIQEHTTDTAGYTEIVFGLFDLLGLKFSPRLRDIADQTLYRFDKTIKYKYLESLVTGKIKKDLIIKHWDDLLRLTASLKTGWSTASLLIGKLQSFPRKNDLARALQEYGKIKKTEFILRYLLDNDFRRRINRQLNKGESLHSLRRFLLFANEGNIRKRFPEEQQTQANCLNLATNAIVLWNTVYLQAAVEQLKIEGIEIKDEDLNFISPARFAHINPYGRYYFNLEENLNRKGLRPLRGDENKP
jgi:TnpA family transposase